MRTEPGFAEPLKPRAAFRHRIAMTDPEMSEEVILSLENKPGSLVRALEVVDDAGINIEGVAAESVGAYGVVRLWSQQADKLHELLDDHGFLVERRPAVFVRVPNKPGELLSICRRLAQEEVNIESLFCSAYRQDEGDIVIQAEDVETAREALGE